MTTPDPSRTITPEFIASFKEKALYFGRTNKYTSICMKYERACLILGTGSLAEAAAEIDRSPTVMRSAWVIMCRMAMRISKDGSEERELIRSAWSTATIRKRPGATEALQKAFDTVLVNMNTELDEGRLFLRERQQAHIDDYEQQIRAVVGPNANPTPSQIPALIKRGILKLVLNEDALQAVLKEKREAIQ